MATVKSLEADRLIITPSSNHSNNKLPCYSCDVFHSVDCFSENAMTCKFPGNDCVPGGMLCRV